MKKCREFLKQDLPVCRELEKWSEKFFVTCDILENIFVFLQTKDEKVKEKLLALADKSISLPAKISNDIDIKNELREELGIY